MPTGTFENRLARAGASTNFLDLADPSDWPERPRTS